MAQSGLPPGTERPDQHKEQSTVKDDDQIDQPKTSRTLSAGIGASLKPLFTWHGMDVYPVFGAEGDDDDDDDQNSGSGDDDETGTGTGTQDDGSGTVSRADFDKLRGQLSAADKSRAAAEKRLKEIDDKGKDELTKATERVTELEKAREADSKEIADLRLQNAFLTSDTGITWHDPADALALAERQGYLAEVVGEDGKVDQAKLNTKLKELAKAKPHLVKTGSDDQGSKDKDKEKIAPTGSKVGSKGGKGSSDEPDLSRYSRLLNR